MGLKLLGLREDEEFYELFRVWREGFTNPGTALWPMFTGDWKSDPNARAAALVESTQRLISWHRADPTSHWLKVVDDGTGDVLGGGRWSIYETGKPYDGHVEMEASWWPGGEPREIATICLNQFLATSARLMNKPHAFLNILFTHPEHRRKGVARLIINWGLEHADNLGLESFIESTKEGKPCYETFGFTPIEVNELKVTKEHPGQEWKEAERQLTPFKWWSMLRPAK